MDRMDHMDGNRNSIDDSFDLFMVLRQLLDVPIYGIHRFALMQLMSSLFEGE